MKINFIFFILAFIFNTAIYSQTNIIEIGIEGGPNFSYIKTKDKWFDVTPKFGYSIGAKIKYNLNKNISFISGINYDNKHFQKFYSFPYVGASVKESVTHLSDLYFHYLKLPVYCSFGVNFKRINFHCLAGWNFYYLLLENEDSKFYDNGVIYKELNINTSYTYYRFDFGLLLGTGTSIYLGKNVTLTIDTKFDWGLFDFYKYYGPTRNQSFSITAGLSYGVFKKKEKKN